MFTLCRALLLAVGVSAAVVNPWTNSTSASPTVGTNVKSSDSVSLNGIPVVSTVSSSDGATKVTSLPPSPTQTGNDIETPVPTHPGMVSNCDLFYWVQVGDSCALIASKHKITSEELIDWNKNIGSGCSGLQSDKYVCVSIIGHEGTPTLPDNGIETPYPIQDGLTPDCDTFHYVEEGEYCHNIIDEYRITLAQFYEWNRGVKADCSGMWTRIWVCVSIIGHEPTPVDPGNGIETPVPIQPGMVDNCDAFHFVNKGEYCRDILTKYNITLAQFYKWNTQVGDACQYLWTDSWLCVSVIGHNDPTKRHSWQSEKRHFVPASARAKKRIASN